MTSIRKGFKRKTDDVPQRPSGVQKTPGPSGFTPYVPPTPPTPLDKYLQQEFSDGSNNIKFQSVLEQLGLGTSDSTQLLAALLGAGNNGFTDERWDMFYQFLLGLMSQSDQRAYDFSMLQESRQYSNPSNELARLMGSGVSRDAAIQILSGSAGGSGVGSAMIGSGANPFTAGVSAPSGSMDLQRQQSIAGTIFGAIGALNSLMQSGVSMAQGIEQVKMLNSQNYFNRQQMQSYDAVQQFAQALQSMQSKGEIEIDGLSNANDLIKYLQDAAKTNENVANLVQSPAYAQSLGTPYGRDYFNSYWKSIRDTRDAGTVYDEYVRGLRFDNAIKQLQPELIGAEISKIGMANKVAEQSIIESANRVLQGEAQIQYLNKQGQWVDAQTALTVQQTANAATEGKILYQNYEYNEAGFPMLKQNRIDELTLKAIEWNTKLRENGQGYVKQMQKAWLTEGSNAADAAYVMSLYYNAVGDFATEHPGLYQLGTCFKLSGMDKLIKIGGAVAAPELIPAFK